MRSYQRKTLVRKESWPLIDGWYWCPPSVVKERIDKEEARILSLQKTSALPFDFLRWGVDQKRLDARLAHACHDGRIRAPAGWGIETFRHVGGIIRIYGKCRFCDEPLSDGIKTIIMMGMMDQES